MADDLSDVSATDPLDAELDETTGGSVGEGDEKTDKESGDNSDTELA